MKLPLSGLRLLLSAVLVTTSIGITQAAPPENCTVFPEGVRSVDATNQYQLVRLWPQRRFDCPVALAIMPTENRREVLMLQRGAVWLLPANRMTGAPSLFLDFRENLKSAFLFEEGFHGLAFHPDFARNGKFYISYSTTKPRRSVISELRAKKPKGQPWRADPSTERVLLEQAHPMGNHFGGGIAFGPDKMLYIAIGDGGLRDDPYRTAQNPLMLLGKMLRIDVNKRTGALAYGIPADNPFAEKQEVRPEVWTLGLRNPWGFAFDVSTGNLWCADVGQDMWEKITLVHRGANCGWSDFDGPKPSAFHSQPLLPNLSYTPATFAYTHAEGVCIVGGYLYRGTRLPALNGSYLFGDWGHGWISALQLDADGTIPRQRLMLARRGGDGAPFNPTMIAAGADGEPVIMSQEGALYTLGTSGAVAEN